MKKFFHYFNYAVSLLAGICTIILFVREIGFHNSIPATRPDSTISSTDDKSNLKKEADSGLQTYNTFNNHDSPVTSKSVSVESTAVKLIKPKAPAEKIGSTPKESANFFVTFIKTPVVFYALLISLVGCLFVGVYQLFQNIFTKFEHGFETTLSIWNWGWNDVTLNWWWNNGVGWHLAISIAVWGIIFYFVDNQE